MQTVFCRRAVAFFSTLAYLEQVKKEMVAQVEIGSRFGVRQKLLLLFSSVAVLIFGISLFFSVSQRRHWNVLLVDWQKQKSEQLASILPLLGRSLELLVSDYTYWDDMVEYCHRPDPAWARENLESALKSYRLDSCWVLSLAGEWVYSQDRLTPAQRQLLPMADRAKVARLFAGNRRFVHFFCWIGGELIEIRGGTVHPSSDLKRLTPPQGYLFTGKRWDPKFQGELQGLLDCPIRLLFAGEPPPPPGIDPALGEYQVLKGLPGWDQQTVASVLARGKFTVLAMLRQRSWMDLVRGALLSLILLMLLGLVLNRWLHKPLNLLAGALSRGDPSRLEGLRRRADEFGAMADVTVRFFEQQQELRGQARKVKNLLDNTGQGILSLAPDLRVNPEASHECERLFGCAVTGVSFPELAYPGNPRDGEVLAKVLARLYSGDARMRTLMLPLLPGELSLNGLHLSLQFRWIVFGDGHEGVMVVITDVTGQRALEGQMEEERRLLQRVVKIASFPQDFAGLLADFRGFLAGGETEFSSEGAEKGGGPLFRRVHTFKASFAMFEMSGVAKELLRLEEELRSWQDSAAAGKGAPFPGLSKWRAVLLDILEEDLALVSCALPGEPWNARHDKVQVPENRLDELAGQVASLSPQTEGTRLAGELLRLRNRSLKEMLSLYPDYTLSMAARLGKSVRPFVPEGEDVAVDPRRFHPVIKNLIHVFRNAVDHGLEGPDERVAAGKSETGTISLQFGRQGDWLLLSVRDDGRGLDAGEMRRRGEAMGLVVPSGDQAAFELVWRDGFTTRKVPDSLSGEGEGLPALRRAVLQAGGETGIGLLPQGGTEVWIRIPLSSPPVCAEITREVLS